MKHVFSKAYRRLLYGLAGVTVLGLAACSSGADAGGGNPSDITFAVGAPVLIDSTAPYGSVPKAMGYWKDEGLNVNIQPTKGATESMQLLLAGKSDIANGGSAAFYQAAAKSPELRVVSLQTKNIWQVVVPQGSDIKSIADLKGKTIGVQSLSSASNLFGRAAVGASGLNPESDVKWLSVGVGNQAAQGLRDGTIDAYATYDGPSGVVSTALGKELVNLPTPLDEIPGLLGIATTDEFLKNNREIVAKFLKGTYMGAVFAAANPGAALQIHWQEFPDQKPKNMSTQQAIERTLPNVESRYASGAEPGSSGKFGDVPMGKVQKSIDFMVEHGILEQSVDASQIVDLGVSGAASEFDVAGVEKQAKNWKPGS